MCSYSCKRLRGLGVVLVQSRKHDFFRCLGGWGTVQHLLKAGYFNSKRTNAAKAWQQSCWRAPEKILAFHYVSKKSEQHNMCDKAQAQKQPCGRCCATAVSSIRLLKPYKLDTSSKSSFSMYARRQNSFSLGVYWNRTKQSGENACFSGSQKQPCGLPQAQSAGIPVPNDRI